MTMPDIAGTIRTSAPVALPAGRSVFPEPAELKTHRDFDLMGFADNPRLDEVSLGAGLKPGAMAFAGQCEGRCRFGSPRPVRPRQITASQEKKSPALSREALRADGAGISAPGPSAINVT